MEKGGRRDEPQGSWMSGEGRARPRLPHEPRSHAAADISHRTFIADFQKPAPDFFPVPSPPGPLGATIPLRRQMVTAAITQGQGMITCSAPHIKVTKEENHASVVMWPQASDTRRRSKQGWAESVGSMAEALAGVNVGETRLTLETRIMYMANIMNVMCQAQAMSSMWILSFKPLRNPTQELHSSYRKGS